MKIDDLSSVTDESRRSPLNAVEERVGQIIFEEIRSAGRGLAECRYYRKYPIQACGFMGMIGSVLALGFSGPVALVGGLFALDGNWRAVRFFAKATLYTQLVATVPFSVFAVVVCGSWDPDCVPDNLREMIRNTLDAMPAADRDQITVALYDRTQHELRQSGFDAAKRALILTPLR